MRRRSPTETIRFLTLEETARLFRPARPDNLTEPDYWAPFSLVGDGGTASRPISCSA
jgi:hypothetical protein